MSYIIDHNLDCNRVSHTNPQEIQQLLDTCATWTDPDTGIPMVELTWSDGYSEVEELAKTVYCLAYVTEDGCLDPDAEVTQTCGDPFCIDPKHLVLVS